LSRLIINNRFAKKKTMKLKLLFATLTLALAFTSCKKKEATPEPEPTPTPTYSVPTSYNFTNVNYAGQTSRLDMLAEIKTYMSTGNTSLTVLSAQKLKDMYANVNNQFTNSALNTSGKSIKSKVILTDQSIYEVYMDNIAAASTATTIGSNGVAGVVVSSTDPSKKYLFDANGVEWTQVIEKGIMGSLCYYQTTAVYMSDAQIGSAVDNTNVVAGEGTAMEHHWDEGFGYLGAPITAPTATAGVRFWAKYANDRNTILNTYTDLNNAFIKGRAAISAKDYTVRDAQVILVRDTWEKVIAATIISYVNSTKLKITDDAIRNHNCSEIKGFIINLKCNPTKKISASEITQIEGYLGANFYNITATNLDNIKNLLSTIYNLDSVKNTL
jgi:hypothetical protein